MHALTSTQGIVALVGAGVGIVALVFAAVLAVRLRTVRQSQRVVLGDNLKRDLIAHAERLEVGFADLREWVEEAMDGLDRRTAGVEGRFVGPTDTDYGIREFGYVDPDGTLHRVGSPLDG